MSSWKTTPALHYLIGHEYPGIQCPFMKLWLGIFVLQFQPGNKSQSILKTQYNGQEVAQQDIKIPRSMCTAMVQRLASVSIGNCLMLNFVVISLYFQVVEIESFRWVVDSGIKTRPLLSEFSSFLWNLTSKYERVWTPAWWTIF